MTLAHRLTSLLAVAAMLAFGVAACGGATGSSPSAAASAPVASIAPSGSASASPAPSAAPSVGPVSPMTGLVVAVDSAGLTKVRGFTLRAEDGTTYDFTIGTLENGTAFPPGHLSEHQATGAPVRVFFRPGGGNLVVYRIEDAGG